MSCSIRPFEIKIEDHVIEDLRARLDQTRLPAEPTDAGWQYGINLTYLSDLIEIWKGSFDWAAEQDALNKHNHFIAAAAPEGLGPLDLHFVHEQCGQPNAPTIVLLAGWPSSHLEYRNVIDRLVRPTGDEISYNAIVIDLPGFGLSQGPDAPVSPRTMAKYVKTLLVEGVGLQNVHVQGGDWGSVVGSWLAFDAEEIVDTLFLTMLGLRPATDRSTVFSEAEQAWLKETRKRLAQDGGYREAQATKPTTAAVGLADSPAALLAWIVEKYHGWTTVGLSADIPPLPQNQILTSATLYWATNHLPTANWVYWADRHIEGTRLPDGRRVETPTGFAFFDHGFFPVPPTEWTQRAYNTVSHTVMDHGGHFPAWANPQGFEASLRGFLKPAT